MWKQLKAAIGGDSLREIAGNAKAQVFKGVDKLPDSLKDNSVIDLLKETSSKLGAILKGIDKVLNTKEKLGAVKAKATDLFGAAKTKAKGVGDMVTKYFGDKDEVKGKDEDAKDADRNSTAPPGKLKAAGAFLGRLAKKGVDKFTGTKKDTIEGKKKPSWFSGGLPPGDDEEKEEAKEAAAEKKKSLLAAGKERFQASMATLKSKMDFRKKEVDDEGNAVKAKPKKDGGGFMGKILTSILGLGATIVGGITKGMGFIMKDVILAKGIPLLGRTLMSSIGLLMKAIPGLGGIAGGIAKATQSGVGGLLKGAFRGAKAIVTSKALWSGVGTAARVAGSVALRAGGMLLTGPVGWAVGVGTLAYGGYQAYKYLNRNNISNLVKLRMLQYGLDESMKENYYRLIALEDVTSKFMQLTPGGGYLFKGLTKDLNADIMSIFGVKEDDETFEEKKGVLAKWLSLRFFPVFKSHLDALYNTDSKKKFDDVDSLDKSLVAEYLGKLSVPPQVYGINQMVIETIQEIRITQVEVETYKASLVAYHKANAVKKATNKVPVLPAVKPTPAPLPPVPPKTIDAIKPNVAMEDVEPPKPQTDKALDVKPDTKVQQQYTKDQTAPEGKAAVEATKPVNKLGGPMVAPTSALEGIRLVNGLEKEAIYNLDPNTQQLFTSMAAEYKKLTGKDIPVVEGFRSRERQAQLYAKYPGKAAKPGNSTHEFGLAIDVDSGTADALDQMGLMRKYGFTRPIGKEKWHLEPIGVSLDPARAKASPKGKLEAVEASIGKGGGGYGTLDSSVMKRRNIPYQVSLFTNAKDNKVDYKSITKDEKPLLGGNPQSIQIAKADVKTAAPVPATPAGAPKKTLPTGNTAQVSEDVAPPKAQPDAVSTDKGATTVAYNKSTDLSTYKDLSAREAIQKASELTGVDVKTLTRFAEIESSMRTDVQAKTSSATGLFQFTNSTWKYMLDKHGATYNIPPDAKPDNALYNSILGGQYIKDNLAALGTGYKQTGMDDTTAAYLAHHYGPTGAKKFIDSYASSPEAKVAEVVSPKAYAANKQELGDNTVKSYVMQVAAKVNKTPNMAGGGTTGAASTQQAVYKPPQAPQTPSSTPPSSGMQTALYKPSTPSSMPIPDKSTPAVTTSAYTYTPPAAAAPAVKAETTLNKTASTTTVDMSTMEGIATKQLSVLENIRDLISSIAGSSGGGNAPTPQRSAPPENKRLLSTASVDVSRKTYS